jgi:aspartate aminotransferase
MEYLESESQMDYRKKKLQYRPIFSTLSANPGAELIRYGRDKAGSITLAQGQGDAATPAFICDAVNEAMREGKTFYGSPIGEAPLREEISAYYKRIFDLDLPTNRIFVTNSGTTAMDYALTALLDPGDDVIAITPIWKNLLSAIEVAEANAIEVPLSENTENGQWSLDLDKIFDSVTDKTRAILIVSPSNPTGWVITPDEIKALLEFSRKTGVWIVADEVYNRLTLFEDHAPSFLEYAQERDFLLTVNSFSKAWAMTGWRLGWLVGPPCAEAIIRDIALYNTMGPPTQLQYGGIAALRDGEDFIKSQKQAWISNREILIERFKDHPRIRMNPPKATFYSFFRVDGEEKCVSLCKDLVDDVGLVLAPGISFGKDCAGYLRLCYAVSEDLLNEALDRLEKAVR